MSEYVIISDSSCDLPAQMALELELTIVPLTVRMGDREYANYLDGREITPREFYQKMRDGAPCQTSAVNSQLLVDSMESFLQEGKDILYLAFSSGLSATYQNGILAASDLVEKYPGRKIFLVDTRCASLGQGLLCYLCVQEKKNGKTIEEVRDFAENTKQQVCQWFIVDDLNHLRRGGRISATTAIVGTMLNIKPVLHVDQEGHLIKMGTVRGRQAALKALVDHMEKTVTEARGQLIFISHGDCEEDARYVADLVKERFGVQDFIIHFIGPVIGAHAGPGTVALFFLGTER
jgi:DegV family protein with EDD domain